ncbi:MAG: hypothetical protein AB9873_13275 [Syntrophobacteraceae bacterium]
MRAYGASQEEAREFTPADILNEAREFLESMVNRLLNGDSLSEKQINAIARCMRLMSRLNGELGHSA